MKVFDRLDRVGRELRQAIRGLASVRPLSAFIAASTGQQRFQAFLLSSFTLLALALASVGIYGVTAYSVSRRTAEMGLRIALGARPRDILWLIISWTMRLAGLGVAVGTLLSFGAAWTGRHLLFRVAPFDPVIYLSAVLTLAIVALCACLIPALRAARLNPATAQRE